MVRAVLTGRLGLYHVCDYLLVFYCNYLPLLSCFLDTVIILVENLSLSSLYIS